MRPWRAFLTLIILTSIACAPEPDAAEQTTDAPDTTGREILGGSGCDVIRCVQGYVCVESPSKPATCAPDGGLITDFGASQPPACQVPVDRGPCGAFFPRWAFKPRSNRCEQFIYGGCGGNANNFWTQAACEQACPASAGPPPVGGPFQGTVELNHPL